MTVASILFVDDEPMLLELYREVLEAMHHILTADSVGAALAILEDEPVDAVVCDYRLPDGRGEDVLDWVRERRPDLLARTAFLTGEDVSGVCSRDVMTLAKPLPMERLIEVVEGWFPGGEVDA